MENNPEIHTPNWVKPENSRLLIPALLVGAWDETKESDRELIASLALKSYEQVITEMSHWLNTFDSPIEKLGNIWRLVSHDVAWNFLSRFLIEDDLSRFGKIVATVLGVLDPRLAANADNKELPYSKVLMQGISETLALLSIRGLPVATQYAITAQHRVNIVVDELLNIDTDWEKWASFSYSLPILAEAAPDVFLEALTDALAEESPTLTSIFQENIWSESQRIDLLQAIEIFAWEPIYFSRSALILSKLSRLDPGDKLVNLPFDSLHQIFSCLQTPITPQQRLRVIDALLIREPTIAWRLLCNLLPEINQEISRPICRPRWRDWNVTCTPSAEKSEYWHNIEQLLKRIIASAGNSSERWCDVIEKIDLLPPHLLDQVICTFEKVAITKMKSGELTVIRNTLKGVIDKHRESPKTKMAMQEKSVDKLDLLCQKLTPA
jgi:hypothetical protein